MHLENSMGRLEGVRGTFITPARVLLESLLIFLAHVLLFRMEALFGYLPQGFDGYYHYTMAGLHSLGNIAQDVDFLPYTYLGENPVNHHWLFHWLLKPLTLLPEASNYSIENATIAWGAALPALLNVVLRLARIPYAPLVSVLAIWITWGLPGRFLMLRAQNLGLLFIVLLQVLGSQRKYLLFGVALFFFNHAYQAAVLAGFTVLTLLLVDIALYRKVDYRLPIYALLGLGLSLLTSPWFPGNVNFLVFHLLFVISNPFAGLEISGYEWEALGPLEFLLQGYPAIFCLAITALLLFRLRAQADKQMQFRLALSLLLLAVIFGMLAINTQRFMDYFGPTTVIALGAALSVHLQFNGAPTKLLYASLVAVGLLAMSTVRPGQVGMTDQFETYSSHCEFLRDNYVKDSLVFNASRWSTFSLLLQCNTGARFVAGLDGNMLAYGDQEVFRVWYLFYSRQFEQNEWGPEVLAAIESVFDRTNTRLIIFSPDQLSAAVKLSETIPGIDVLVTEQGHFLLTYAPANGNQPNGHPGD